MRNNLHHKKLALQNLINSNQLQQAIKLSHSLIKKHNDIELLLLHIQLQLITNDYIGSETTRKLIHKNRLLTTSVHTQLAAIFKNHGQYQAAINEYKLALENKKDVALFQELAALYLHTRQYSNASVLLESATNHYPESSQLFLMLGACYQSLQEIDKSQSSYEKAHHLSRDNIDAIIGIAGILYLRRQYNEAEDLLKPLLEKKPYPFPALAIYANISALKNDQKKAIKKLTETSDSSLAPIHRSTKYFSLGKLNDKIHNYDTAFKHYNKANNLHQQNYNQEQYEQYFRAIINSHTHDVIDKLKRRSKDQKNLIFIVGMPRSGTSLAEQILASHPDIYGAGELSTLGNIINQIPTRDHLTTRFPYFTNELSHTHIEDAAHQYLNHIESINQNKQTITDKMPDNFLYIGLISILFPYAKIIHCTRNPIDTCLSCYFQQFSGDYSFAYQLENLAHYYNLYQKLMSHWKDSLQIPMFELNYEELVSDKESVIRKLQTYCDLKEHQACHEFNKSSRAVTTASSEQVGKEMYYTSVERWRNYELHLKPLINGLNTKS